MGYETCEKKMIIGENSTREARNGCCYGLHAEMDAIRKLPPLQFQRKKKVIDLIIIRVGKNGNLKNSVPCAMCIRHMNRLNGSTSYKIRNVYYSNKNGNITMTKFSTLSNSPEQYVSQRFRKDIK